MITCPTFIFFSVNRTECFQCSRQDFHGYVLYSKIVQFSFKYIHADFDMNVQLRQKFQKQNKNYKQTNKPWLNLKN